ncbi:uncharacterized protein LOC122501286 [Leptopilina heterotoma]|uniref:uncharacterized protein LOC122501286 n=1 Tax=Leptopilina heterotoma TaxID=63436 RepID=UPI001CA90423|nr:uncharacterized protein LOC122501286 [Leptopilina heterotoma]XP_043466570.1 uncharacterized protein LOC122501286 [Leptopilina heterotoma]
MNPEQGAKSASTASKKVSKPREESGKCASDGSTPPATSTPPDESWNVDFNPPAPYPVEKIVSIDLGFKYPVTANVLDTADNFEKFVTLTSQEYNQLSGSNRRIKLSHKILSKETKWKEKLRKNLKLKDLHNDGKREKIFKYYSLIMKIKKKKLRQKKLQALAKATRVETHKFWDNFVNKKLIEKSKDVLFILGKYIPNVGCGYRKSNLRMLIHTLNNKSKELKSKNIRVQTVDEYNTTRVCSECGEKNYKLASSPHRYYICLTCGHKSDRDKNACINIRQIGLVNARYLEKEDIKGNEFFRFEKQKKPGQRPTPWKSNKYDELICKDCMESGHNSRRSSRCSMYKKTGRQILAESHENGNFTQEIVTRNLKFYECFIDPNIRKGIRKDQDFTVEFRNDFTNFMQSALNNNEIVKYIIEREKAMDLGSFAIYFHGGHGRLKDFPWETMKNLFTDFQEAIGFELIDMKNRRYLLKDKLQQLETNWKNLISLNLRKRMNKFFMCHIPNDPKDPTRKLYREKLIKQLFQENVHPTNLKFFKKLLKGSPKNLDFTKIDKNYWRFLLILKKIRKYMIHHKKPSFDLFPKARVTDTCVSYTTCSIQEFFKRHNLGNGEANIAEMNDLSEAEKIKRKWSTFIQLEEKHWNRFAGSLTTNCYEVHLGVQKQN